MTLFIQASAEDDILRQVERYAAQGLPQIARRCQTSVLAAIDALMAMPGAGPPKHIANPALAGLRAWPVKGFDAFWIYYLGGPERVSLVRVPHGKRDIGTILEAEHLQPP